MLDSLPAPAPQALGPAAPRATRTTCAGVALLALATLMLEVLLTRIFSVTMWYHFAFMAISLAMFGMTAGAISVFQHGRDYPARTKPQMALSALLFAVFVPISLIAHVLIPFLPEWSWEGVFSVGLTYLIMAAPFFFSGIALCLAVTQFPEEVGKVYAADLSGAAAGCLLTIPLLEITDAPTAVVLTACAGAVAALMLARDAHARSVVRGAAVVAALTLSFVAVSTVEVHRQKPLVRLIWAKGWPEYLPLYEKWNSFSRITVSDEPARRDIPWGWGLSRTFVPDKPVRQLFLRIDSSAETVLTDFHGDWGALDYLKYDVTNLAYHLRSPGRVYVVGAGAGRDVLAALVMGEDHVLGAEVNENILKAVNGPFGDFTGHLDRDSRVTLVSQEARSYLGRLSEKFDVIQVSFLGTWAATAAGAFALTENSLFTVEAWTLFLNHLTPRGVISCSRWYYPPRPAEAYRFTALAAAALRHDGIRDPRKHILLVRNLLGPRSPAPQSVATLLVSREAFSAQDLDKIEAIARDMQFEIVLSPRTALNPTFAALAEGQDPASLRPPLALKIEPPTDDSPFFFNMLRLRDVRKTSLREQGLASVNMQAIQVLGVLLLVVLGLSFLVIALPLARLSRQAVVRVPAVLLVFFGAIGLGFMFIEISMLQRLTVFLGPPAYALSVVLFTLLLASGLGSYTVRDSHDPRGRGTLGRLGLLLAAVAAWGVVAPFLWRAGSALPMSGRVGLAVASLFPLGFFMGMAFPVGLKLAAERSKSLTPWFWGINGATSVCGSVLAVDIAINSGISMAFWAGWASYAVALLAFIRARKR